MTLLRLIIILTVGLNLSACATLNTQLPAIDSYAIDTELNVQRKAALKKYVRQFRRLQDIARPILAKNVGMCSRLGGDIGAYTVSQKDLPKALRDKTSGLPITSPAIIYIRDAPNAPSISRPSKGSVILSANGKPMTSGALKADVKTITVRSAGKTRQVAVESTPVCGYPARLKYSPEINAYANGREIIVTTGMMDFANDAQIAVIVGHELAHNTQGHIRKIIQNTILALGRGSFARKFESEADYLGLYYAARAGYALEQAPGFWRKLALTSVKSLEVPKSHPITPERFVRLRAAITEIDHKRARGVPLLPNKH